MAIKKIIVDVPFVLFIFLIQDVLCELKKPVSPDAASSALLPLFSARPEGTVPKFQLFIGLMCHCASPQSKENSF
ncbi:MAG: hypothetical protein CVU71_12230 [Deltaproteobacteria bacterium HGW-Deltaproteobacteria-6]|jgi:hypothetical protein|nr:MAG: hypothetical protein CVU71_12230 [Deltaproteobacteria bacterium HGW-Deltaproteobacteria-6]PKN96142.1 MAG: hypothetical protein CVU43_22240 [Chloroflexi bacterium HGW-Chloroflexi-5]